MKILYYFPEQKTPMYQWHRTHYIDELSHYGIEFTIFNPLEYESYQEANEELLKKIKVGNYQMFLTCLCNEKYIYKETLQEIRRIGIPSCSFRPDNLTIPLNDKNLASSFDLIWLTAKETQHFYPKWGAKTVFLPYAANPFYFNYSEIELKRKVCFIGTPHGSRARIINSFVDSDAPVDVFYGKGNSISKQNVNVSSSIGKNSVKTFAEWIKFKEGRKLIEGAIVSRIRGVQSLSSSALLEILPSVPFDEIGKLYSEYILSIASTSFGHTDILNNPLKVINLRNFEIPMCGGLEICRYNKELASYFEDGKEIVFYNSQEELKDKSVYYLQKASDAEIRKMKEAARKRAESEHTWRNRFEVVFKELGINSAL